jgi:hypothetical protein
MAGFMKNRRIVKRPLLTIVWAEITRRDKSRFITPRYIEATCEADCSGAGGDYELDGADERIIGMHPAPASSYAVYGVFIVGNEQHWELLGYDFPGNEDTNDWDAACARAEDFQLRLYTFKNSQTGAAR